MSRRCTLYGAMMLVLILLASGVMMTVTQWLPRLAGIWLPPGTHITLDANPRWRDGGVGFPGLGYWAGDCALVRVDQLSLGWSGYRWLVGVDNITLNSACLNRLAVDEKSGTPPRTLAQWQSLLPAGSITIRQLTVSPYETWSGAVQVNIDAARQTLHYQGDNVQLDVHLVGQTLAITALTLRHPLLEKPLSMTGKLNLPEVPDTLPLSGTLQGAFSFSGFLHPLTLALDWQGQHGTLTVNEQNDAAPLLSLPWRIAGEKIAIQQGLWRWPYAMQPLSGGINLTLSQWRQGLSEMMIQTRLTMLTQGRGGKGNAVLNVGPGKLDLINSQLPFQLNGESKLASLQFYPRLSGMISGSLLDPQVTLQPGALLRMRGRLLSTLEVEEARWPLAGVKVSSAGIAGRLQAILNVQDASLGRFSLHLDGKADDFWPDKGRWDWRYWGAGYLRPLAANWDVRGTGNWHDTVITLDSLSTGFDRLHYGMVNVSAPRLSVKKPIVWQRDRQQPVFQGEWQLLAQESRLSYGGYLPPSTLNLTLKGSDPAHFLFKGDMQAGAIGPVRINGRWDGQRLRGQAWWPQQSLTVFQPLLNPDLNMDIQSGNLKAQVAFSASSAQGLEAGGHWVVKDGHLLAPDNEVSGINFTLPFRLKAHQWLLGARKPVSLRISEIKNQFSLANITADVQGAWPWNEEQPLELSNVNVDLLGGKLSMAYLAFPQQRAAILRLQRINLSELVTALKPKAIAMSGHINGELPLWLSHPQWLIKEGWIANDGHLTLRLDTDMADAISANNMASGAALDWLRYMDISRAWATINLNTVGGLTMNAEVNGTSRFRRGDQRVTLNYTHQENVFQLWRSLRFGDNLHSWLEQNSRLPLQKEKK